MKGGELKGPNVSREGLCVVVEGQAEVVIQEQQQQQGGVAVSRREACARTMVEH
jgi:hypothetical protein